MVDAPSPTAIQPASSEATEAAGAALSTPQKSELPPAGPRRTPFPHPASSASVPEPSTLTTEQTTAYNSLLNTVATWTSIGETDKAGAAHTPLGDSELMWLSRECLLRYLRASKWVVATAQTRLLNTLLWRRSYGLVSARPDQAGPKITADYIGVENETGKQWLLGYDNAGRPCHYLNPSRQNTKRSDRQIEHLVFMLERAIDLMPQGQETLALLINFAETSSGQGASIGQGKQTINILQNHYPERLGRALLCNLPWHFWAFMKVITPFIDPVTRSKIVFNNPLEKHVPPEQLLKSHGGSLSDFEYDHSTYWPALITMAEERRKLMHERWVHGGKRVGENELYLKGGTDASLAKDEENRRGKERGGIRGRTLQLGAEQKREKSVSILAEGEQRDALDKAVENEGDKVEAEKAEELQAETTKEGEEPLRGSEDKGCTGLEKKVEDLKVGTDGLLANGEPRATNPTAST